MTPTEIPDQVPSRHHELLDLNRRQRLLFLVLLGAALYLAAVIGIAYVAGFHAVWRHFQQVNPPWIAASLGGVVVSWAGYYLAFEGVASIPGGPRLNGRQRLATVAAGFGSFLHKGGGSVDTLAMRRDNADRDANVRVSALKSLEHAPIAVGTCIASIILLSLGRADPPPLDFTWPWAVCPVGGAAIALILAARYRERLRARSGILQGIGIALDGIWMLRKMAIGGRARGLPFVGMGIFWAGDVFALWAALLAFSEGISFAGVVLGYAVGYVLTRRSCPLGGAGLIDLVLPLALWACGASFAGAVAAVIAYRFLSLWVPLPGALAALPTIRSMSTVPYSKQSEPALQTAV